MASNPGSLPQPLSTTLSSSPLSQAARLPLTVERTQDVISSVLALLRAIQRDTRSSLAPTDSRFISARDALRALHLEMQSAWFDSQLEVGGASGAGSRSIVGQALAKSSRKPRGPRKLATPALGSSPLGTATPGTVDTSGGPALGADRERDRNSLLSIAAPLTPTATSTPITIPIPTPVLGEDDIPDLPGEAL